MMLDNLCLETVLHWKCVLKFIKRTLILEVRSFYSVYLNRGIKVDSNVCTNQPTYMLLISTQHVAVSFPCRPLLNMFLPPHY